MKKDILKKLIIALCLIAFNITSSQSGKVYPKNDLLILGEVNTYIYEPKNENIIPDGAVAKVLINGNINIFSLVRKGNNFEFLIKAPESTNFLVMTFVNNENIVIDNNANQGFVIYLKTRTEEEKLKSKLSFLKSQAAANYFLGLSITNEDVLSQFKDVYQNNAKLKEGGSYQSYLFLLYQINQAAAKAEMIVEAEKLSKTEDEKSLMNSFIYYQILGEITEYENLKKIILQRYPVGELAKRDFIMKFEENKEKTVEYVWDSLQEYKLKFNDDSLESKDPFYMSLLNIYIEKKDIEKIDEYENLLSDNQLACYLYNEYAWKLSGGDLFSSGTDLPYAVELSKRSLDIIEEHLTVYNQDLKQETHNTYADTYALILYKQKKYEEAFKYQDVVEKNGGLDTGGKERYAAIAEKANGDEFAKEYIEKQLLAGLDSKILLNQLQKIYKKLKLPENEFDRIKENSLKIATQKAKEELIKMYGDVKAIDFTLTNLEGKPIKLSDYKGKIVVLDFWATWCGPCLASFPKMQELVTKYKNENIEFFFINTWERESDSTIKESVSKYINGNNYSFNVLFDFENKIVASYKIQGIPTKIVIDKDGNIISINSSDSNLVALIEENIK